MTSIDQALKMILEVTPLQDETHLVSLDEIVGSVIRESILADRDLPPFNRAMMDGYAFHSQYIDVKEKLKIVGEVFPGESLAQNFQLKPNEVLKIFTGAALPHFCDTVTQHEWFIKVNDTIFLQDGKSLKKGSNIHRQGSDALKNDILIKEGTLINSRHLPTLLSVGRTQVKVSLKPKISIITTGNEVVKPNEEPKATQIRDCNLQTLGQMARTFSESVELLGPVPDDLNKLRETLKRALHSEVVLVSAGVSAGEHDFVPFVLRNLA